MKAALLLLVCAASQLIAADKPNIIFILADDLGYNDIGYNNGQVITPNLDELARNGRILTSNYVGPSCSPSRSALMTSWYPYRSTMAHLVLGGPWCSPTDLTFLPQRLKNLGYETAQLGKWHLGFCQDQCMPKNRGFDHQYGLMHGSGDYYLHSNQNLYDFRDDQVTDWSANNTYTTDLLGARAVTLIENTNNPLFMYLAFTTPHTPLQVPGEFIDMYRNVECPRQTYLAMTTAMDVLVGNIVQTLQESGKWDNTLIIFSSDNGGEPGGASDNSPYRGCKASLWEGGTRVVGFVAGGVVNNGGQEHDGIFNIVDWTPTLVHLAGGVSTAGDVSTTDGSKCAFPFTYKGQTYTGCTSYNHDTDWCALTTEYDGSWGECVQEEAIAVAEGNHPAEQRYCVFPFKYNNKMYSSCVTTNHHERWCGTTADYDADKLWADCRAPGPVLVAYGNRPAEQIQCTFPFKYNNNWIDSCITTNHDAEWCGTSMDYDADKYWGECVASDGSLNGVDQYEMIINGRDSVRNEIIYNIDYESYAATGHAAIRVDDWKLIWGHEGMCDGWGIGVEDFWRIPEQCAMAGVECPPPSASSGHQYTEEEMYVQSAIIDAKNFTVDDINSGLVHLFNLADDPYETNDLANDPVQAERVLYLKQQLIDRLNMEYVSPPPPIRGDPWAAAKAVQEPNPDAGGMNAWGLNWCDDLDITIT